MEFERERYERIKRIVNKYMYYANGRIYIRTKRTDEKGSKESQFINLILTTTYAAYMTEVLFIRRLSMFKVRHRDFCHYFLICNFKTSGALYLSFT